jgi:hypothetical protein
MHIKVCIEICSVNLLVSHLFLRRLLGFYCRSKVLKFVIVWFYPLSGFYTYELKIYLYFD